MAERESFLSSLTTSDLVFRFGLGATGFACWSAASFLSVQANFAAQWWTIALMMGSYGFGFVCFAGAALAKPPKWVGWLVPLACALIFVDYLAQRHIAQEVTGAQYVTDLVLYGDYGVRLLLSGENPYAADLHGAYTTHLVPIVNHTPLVGGNLTGRLAYPALHLLVHVPFHVLGVHPFDIYPIFLAAAMILMYWAVDARFRPLVLLPFVLDESHFLYPLNGVSDIGWVVLLVLMIVAWKRPWARAILFGLACSYKQHPWLLAPFLLVQIAWQTEGTWRDRLRQCLRFAAGSSGTFLIINLPFIVWNPAAWFQGVTEPAVAPMITWGQGISSLTAIGEVILPRPAFAIFQWSGLFLAVLIYAREYPRIPALLWIVPGVVLFFAHRSLTSYWYYTAYPLLTAVLLRADLRLATRDLKPVGKPWPSLALVGVFLVAVAGTAFLVSRAAPAFTLRINGPMHVIFGYAHQLEVNVRNDSGETVTPRFQVQQGAMQPFYWDIVRGPKILADGQSGSYTLFTPASFENFNVSNGARIIVSDAERYSPRAAIEIPRDLSFGHPNAIPNGQWRFWEWGSPYRWAFITDRPTLSHIENPRNTERPILRMHQEGNPDEEEYSWSYLDTTVAMPWHDLTVHVRPPPGANDLENLDLIYGYLFIINYRSVWVLFGPEAGQGTLPDGQHYISFQAPYDEWSTHSINVRNILSSFDLVPDPYRHILRYFWHIDIPMRPMNFRLMLGVRNRRSPINVDFGEIHNSRLQPDTDGIFEEMREHPEYLRRWNEQFLGVASGRPHNIDSSDTILARDPNHGPSLLRRAEYLAESQEWEEAEAYYQRAVDVGFEPGRAQKGIGWTRLQQLDYEGAEEAFRAALREFEAGGPVDKSQLGDAWKGIGLARAARGDCEGTEEAFDSARRLAPTPDLRLPAVSDVCTPRPR